VNGLPALLQGFFTGKLVIQRQASPATVASYRDTFALLLAFAAARAGRQPHQLQVTDLDAETIGAFLTHLEKRAGQQHRDPQRQAGRDPVVLPLRCPARPPACPADRAGPGDPRQAGRQGDRHLADRDGNRGAHRRTRPEHVARPA
jgi:hypothetical protein